MIREFPAFQTREHTKNTLTGLVGEFTYHSVYGVQLQSNVPIPGLLVLDKSDSAIDFRVRLKEKSHPLPIFSESFRIIHQSQYTDDRGNPNVRVCVLDKNYFAFFYPDNLRFAVARDGHEVVGDWPDDYSLEDAATYLLGPVMGFVLRLRGILPLHASGIAIDGHAIALIGAPGAGKSTTAAAFAKLGFPILSEDVVALTEQENTFWAQPGYPRINLWPASAKALFGADDALPLVTPAWGKRFLALGENGFRFQGEPLPLAAIYLLGDRDSEAKAPSIESLHGMRRFMTLVDNTYVNYALDGAMRTKEFDVLGRLAESVPLLSVRASGNAAHIPDLCMGITDDVSKRFNASEPSDLNCAGQRVNTSPDLI